MALERCPHDGSRPFVLLHPAVALADQERSIDRGRSGRLEPLVLGNRQDRLVTQGVIQAQLPVCFRPFSQRREGRGQVSMRLRVRWASVNCLQKVVYRLPVAPVALIEQTELHEGRNVIR